MNNTRSTSAAAVATPHRTVEANASLSLHRKALRIHGHKYPSVNGVFTPLAKIARDLKRSEQDLRLLIEGRGGHIHFGRYVCVGRLREILEAGK